MALKYSASTKAFFDTETNWDIPLDAIEITEDYHSELMSGQSRGQVIEADKNGVPQLVTPAGPTLEEARVALPPLSRRQVFIGLMASKLITEAEALASGTAMPAMVEAAIKTLPKDSQSPARLTFAMFVEARRMDPIVALLGAAAGMDDAALDAFWTTFAAV